MKKYFHSIVTAVLCVAVGICMLEIYSLKNQLNELNTKSLNRAGGIYNRLDSLHDDIQELIDEQDNLISEDSYKYRNTDVSKGTVELVCEISPKRIVPEGSQAILMLSGEEHLMETDGNKYTLTAEIPLFEDSLDNKVVFKKGDSQMTQTLEWKLYPRQEAVPSLTADFSGSLFLSGDTLRLKGRLEILLECIGVADVEVESVRLIELANVKEINGIWGFSRGTTIGNQYYSQNYSLDASFDAPGCKTYEIIAEVIDTDGVKYICPAVKWVKDGLAFNQDGAYQTGYEIYKNGSIIYKSESL